MPRNSENEPSVTMSGGMSRRAISTRVQRAARAADASSATRGRGRSGRCQSCTAAPNTTAASPIIEPTDRSMPPVMITGVSATASSPSSTLSRSDLEEVADA